MLICCGMSRRQTGEDGVDTRALQAYLGHRKRQDYSHHFRFFARLKAGKHAQNPKWCSRLEDKALVVARFYYPLKLTCSERPTYSTSTASLLVKYRPCHRKRIGRFAQRHCSSRQARWQSTPSREAAAKRSRQPRCKLTRE